jgi:hypothetical protein
MFVVILRININSEEFSILILDVTVEFLYNNEDKYL